MVSLIDFLNAAYEELRLCGFVVWDVSGVMGRINRSGRHDLMEFLYLIYFNQ